MIKFVTSAIVVVMLSVPAAPALAGGGYFGSGPKAKKQVRGYRQRRGGYSYSPSDTINTYGDSRSIYGGASAYRDPMLDRQTRSGPFDHGWFFDSGIGHHGGNSPYFQ